MKTIDRLLPADLYAAYLYRARDKNGNLLYIGITTQPKVRMDTHASTSPWMELCQKPFEWVGFDSIESAQEAERDEIFKSCPPFNKTGNPESSRVLDEHSVRYNFFIKKSQLHALKVEALEKGVSVASLVNGMISNHFLAKEMIASNG